MKKYFKVIKIGNSIFSLLPSNLVKQLEIKPGDNVFYEIVPDKKQVLLNFTGESSDSTPNEKNINKKQNKWVDNLAGSLTL
jgi:antitoxin component of MazEF toxin-antitoxin module